MCLIKIFSYYQIIVYIIQNFFGFLYNFNGFVFFSKSFFFYSFRTKQMQVKSSCLNKKEYFFSEIFEIDRLFSLTLIYKNHISSVSQNFFFTNMFMIETKSPKRMSDRKDCDFFSVFIHFYFDSITKCFRKFFFFLLRYLLRSVVKEGFFIFVFMFIISKFFYEYFLYYC